MESKESVSMPDREFKAPKGSFRKAAEKLVVGSALALALAKGVEGADTKQHFGQHEKVKLKENIDVEKQAKSMEKILSTLGLKNPKVTAEITGKGKGAWQKFGETYLVVLPEPLRMTVVINLKKSGEYHKEDFLQELKKSLADSDYAEDEQVKKFLEKLELYIQGAKTEKEKMKLLSVNKANGVLKKMGLNEMYDIILTEGQLRLVNKGEKTAKVTDPVLETKDERELQNLLINLHKQ